MLVLSRNSGQSIDIGNDIVVYYCGLNRHGRAKIGVIAPENVAVKRSEISTKTVSNSVDNSEHRDCGDVQ